MLHLFRIFLLWDTQELLKEVELWLFFPIFQSRLGKKAIDFYKFSPRKP